MAVQPDQVSKLLNLPTEGSTAPDLTEQIRAAHLIVSEDLTSSGLSQARLDQIELFIAAHFASITYERGGLKSERVGDTEQVYAVISDKANTGLLSTRFGRQAVMLDTSGTLASKAKPRMKAEVEIVEYVPPTT